MTTNNPVRLAKMNNERRFLHLIDRLVLKNLYQLMSRKNAFKELATLEGELEALDRGKERDVAAQQVATHLLPDSEKVSFDELPYVEASIQLLLDEAAAAAIGAIDELLEANEISADEAETLRAAYQGALSSPSHVAQQFSRASSMINSGELDMSEIHPSLHGALQDSHAAAMSMSSDQFALGANDQSGEVLREINDQDKYEQKALGTERENELDSQLGFAPVDNRHIDFAMTVLLTYFVSSPRARSYPALGIDRLARALTYKNMTYVNGSIFKTVHSSNSHDLASFVSAAMPTGSYSYSNNIFAELHRRMMKQGMAPTPTFSGTVDREDDFGFTPGR